MYLLLAVLLACSIVVTPGSVRLVIADDGEVAGVGAMGPSDLELALFELTNRDRIQAGLRPLTFDAELLTVARARGEAQRGEPSLTHFDKAGQLAFVSLIAHANVPYTRAGENLARVSLPATHAAERAERALMQSPTHRANILQPDFDRIAVGQTVDGAGRIIFAQIFRAAP